MKRTAKLQADQVVELRRLYAAGWPVIRLARMFGLSQARIRDAATGMNYKTVPGACEPRPWPRDFRPEVHAGRQWAA